MSPWFMALDNIHGLFAVIDGVDQLHNLDPANLTIMDGKENCIVVDSLNSKEVTSRALLLAQNYLSKHPMTGKFALQLPMEIIDSNNLSQPIDGINFEFYIFPVVKIFRNLFLALTEESFSRC